MEVAAAKSKLGPRLTSSRACTVYRVPYKERHTCARMYGYIYPYESKLMSVGRSIDIRKRLQVIRELPRVVCSSASSIPHALVADQIHIVG